jgi:hypothetical protein
MGRWRQDFKQVRFGVIAVIAVNPSLHPLAWEGERDHNDPDRCILARQRDAAKPEPEIRQGRDFELDLLVVGEGLVSELTVLFQEEPKNIDRTAESTLCSALQDKVRPSASLEDMGQRVNGLG